MSTPTVIIVLFIGMGCAFLFLNMMLGKLLRPSRPNDDKSAIYECGEPTIGSSWIQFDLRFYVVALLFVIFDVEMAFFFPWSTVFGSANKLAREELSSEQRVEILQRFGPVEQKTFTAAEVVEQQGAAKRLAWLSFADIGVFFGVLLVGFAYLWKRGDLDWVRSTAAQQVPESEPGGGKNES